MAISIQITGAIIAGFALCGCATTVGNSSARPTPAATKAADAEVRSYSQDDIERTGKTNVGDALAHLDPSITVHH
jgi:hypothetical protein